MSNFVKVKIYDSEKYVFVYKLNISGIWNTSDNNNRVLISMNNRDDDIQAYNPYETIEEFVTKFE